MTYEREKPDTTKLLEQGHGYAIVRWVAGEPTVMDEPAKPSDGGFDVEEGWVRAEVRSDIDGGPAGVFELGGERHAVPLGRLRLRPPVGMRPLE